MNYDDSLVVTIIVICYIWVPSSGDHLFTCGAIFRPPHDPILFLKNDIRIRSESCFG